MLPDKEYTFRTLNGAILSLITVIAIMLYAGYKMATLVTFADYKVQVRDQEDYYRVIDDFGLANQFSLAAAVTAFDGNSEDIMDP